MTQSSRSAEEVGQYDLAHMCGQVSKPEELGEVATWERVLATPDLIAQATALVGSTADAGYVAAVGRLRNRWPADEVAVALSLADARRRARGKFPDADRLVCDRHAVEQASGAVVSAWKAKRFAAAGRGVSDQVFDLCCGMGGDAMALAATMPTRAVDRSPVRAWMAARNAGCASEVADVTEARCPGALVHIDPARRIEASGARSRTPFHLPSLEACAAIVASARGGAIKVGPGTEPELLPAEATLEWISDGGTLVQLVVWLGALAEVASTDGPTRMATMLPAGVTRVGTPEAVPLTDRWGAILAVADPALERSRLLGGFAREHGLAEPAAGLGILTADAVPASPWLERAAILERVRPDERAVVAALRQCGASRARVRTRGGSADADQWTQRIARALGDAPTGTGLELDLFLLRTGSERIALIARPLP